MRRKKIVSMLLVATMAATMFAGCGNDSGKKGSSGGVKEFDAFFAVPGSEINDDNEIQKIIEEKTGVRVKETWLTGQTADEAVGTMIAGGEYPDFIEGASGQKQLYEAAWTKIGEVKHEQLPQVVMAKNFDKAWNTYMDKYNACNPQDFLDELQTELDKRLEQAAKFK